MKAIVLVGYMGAGKSSVAALLSERSARVALDTDAAIEERLGMSIKEYFAAAGEQAFRQKETELLRELKKDGFCGILSTGGGMVLSAENRRLLKSLGRVFYLKASPAVLAGRLLSDESRPLLMGLNTIEEKEAKIAAMLKEREESYMAAADVVLDTDHDDIELVVEQISRF